MPIALAKPLLAAHCFCLSRGAVRAENGRSSARYALAPRLERCCASSRSDAAQRSEITRRGQNQNISTGSSDGFSYLSLRVIGPETATSELEPCAFKTKPPHLSLAWRVPPGDRSCGQAA